MHLFVIDDTANSRAYLQAAVVNGTMFIFVSIVVIGNVWMSNRSYCIHILML
jgi:hypothetical protein